MIQSTELNEIFTALSKAQGSMNNAHKSSQGHGYSYADLASCIDAVRPHLLENGLAVSQMMGGGSDESRTLITILSHSSGQYIGSEFVMAKAMLSGGSGKNPAQVLGSAITYMRRYAFAAIVGLAQTDDDAACNTPSKSPSKRQESKPSQENKVDIFASFKGQLEKCKNFDEIMAITDSDRFKKWNGGLSADNKKTASSLVADSQERFVKDKFDQVRDKNINNLKKDMRP